MSDTSMITGSRAAGSTHSVTSKGSSQTGVAGQGGSAAVAPQRITVQQVKKRTVKITLPRSSSYTRLDLAESLRQVHFPLSSVEALGTRQQNHQWFLTVSTEEEAADLLSLGMMSVAGKSGFISTLDDTAHRVRIHWAPYHLSQPVLTAALKAALPDGANVVQSGYEKSMVKGLEHVSTLVRYAVVSYEGSAAHLPHLLKVSQAGESFELLLTIQGRKPICLRCKQVGHVRSQCIFCHICKSNLHISSNCPNSVSSYANAIRAGRRDSSGDEAGDRMEVGDEMAEGGDRVLPEVSQNPPSALLSTPEEFPPLDEVTLALNQVRSEDGPSASKESVPEDGERSQIDVRLLSPEDAQEEAEQQKLRSQGPKSTDTQRQAVPPGQRLRQDSRSGDEESPDHRRLIIMTGQSSPQDEGSSEDGISGEPWQSTKRRKKQKKSHKAKIESFD